jgi:hypothetical protein
MSMRKQSLSFLVLCASVGALALYASPALAQMPAHPNPHAEFDEFTVVTRPDVRQLPKPLRQRLGALAERPHTYLAMQAFAEADKPSQLFQYYLLDSRNFEPNVFSAVIPGQNDQAQLTAFGGNGGLPTIGAVRVVLEPKPGLPTDPNDVRAFIDVFTDLSSLFVINNESGWYEGWMIHDLSVPDAAPPRPDGRAQFGKLLASDVSALAQMGSVNGHPGNNQPGAIFTMDGGPVRFPSAQDHFPDVQMNVVPIQESMGAYNAMQQSDVHSYWEFNYTGTNWIHPLYELPFTGGLPGSFAHGDIGKLLSLVPGPGPSGPANSPVVLGDNPNAPRDPDRFEGTETSDAQREFRERGIPSGLANEVYLDTYERIASFEPGVPFPQRLFDAYAAEVARVDANGDGVISAVEGDVDTPSDDFIDNARLYLPATAFNRFAVSREIDDGILAPRFAPSQRAWVLSGVRVPVSPAVPASFGRDGDDR